MINRISVTLNDEDTPSGQIVDRFPELRVRLRLDEMGYVSLYMSPNYAKAVRDILNVQLGQLS